MPINKETIIQRIDYLIDLAEKSTHDSRKAGEVFSGTINILENLYGSESLKCKAYIDKYNVYIKGTISQLSRKANMPNMIFSSLGTLKSIKSEVEAGLVGNLELEAQGGIFGDFITLAKNSLDENKDVAAVLVSAALEDALKRVALQNGLDVADADMSQVINALKGKSLLKGPQASIAQSYTKFRNKAFHAEWDTIDKPSVSSAIGFTESFILEKFS
jgi:hypothetical protein